MYMAIVLRRVGDCGGYDTGGDGTAGDLTSFLSALEAADVQLMNLLILPISKHTYTHTRASARGRSSRLRESSLRAVEGDAGRRRRDELRRGRVRGAR